MAVILAYGSPALGHLLPMGALLAELAGRGHQIHLRTLAGEVAAMRGAADRGHREPGPVGS
jgi:UDP:flavonoid glycosyltransferase YjiC (YdhE family)